MRLDLRCRKPAVDAGVLAIAVLSLAAACSGTAAPPADPVPAIKELVTRKDFDGGARLLDNYRSQHGTTPALLDAMSVLAQGALADGQAERSEVLAKQAYDMSTAALVGRTLDQEPRLPIALGRAIELRAQADRRRGARDSALAFLERQMVQYRGTSIEKRIQKNINLLTLEGEMAPSLDLSEYLGARPPDLSSLRGRVVVLFFWAHWCSDCKAQGPILARLLEKYSDRGLTIVAPTQRYGYVAQGTPAEPAAETPYIDEVRRTYYPALADRPIPLSDANHRRYGVSSTPTIVLLDRQGIVQMYHPGRLGESELESRIRALL
jgi:thiol-disulfide isomerase/thioredoxin